ncbi:MAG: sigma-70 family RNA polymerase sigma factor [Chitinophagaceae bacterium]
MLHPILTDVDLLERIRQRDDDAFKQLFDRFWHPLYSLAFKKTGDDKEAEDMVQELFIELWSKKDPVILTSSLKTYLVSCIYLKTFNYFRKKGFRDRHYEDFARFAKAAMETAGLADLSFETEYGKLRDIIDQTVALMPSQMRLVFSLRHYQGEPVAAIAAQLGISAESVKSHLKIAMSRLRKAGEQYPPGALLLPLFLSMLESSY